MNVLRRLGFRIDVEGYLWLKIIGSWLGLRNLAKAYLRISGIILTLL
jgi:hypothetical protein